MTDPNQQTKVKTPTDSGSRDPVILLLIQNSQDLRLFKKHLLEDFVVKTDEKWLEPNEFDLCIVDGKNSRVHRQALESLKEQASPALLPILLLSQSSEQLDNNTGVLTFVDDVVYIPSSTKLLQSCINLLLRQRRYTLELKKTSRQLKNTNQELNEEKEFINKAIQNMPEIFYVMDEDLNFVTWNNVKGKLGYTDEEVQQMEPLDFLREEDRDLVASKMEETFETGSAEAEVQMETKSGELIPYYITKKKFTKEDKRFLVGSCVNLTELKQAEYNVEQQRQLLGAIINQTDSIIYVKDQDRRYKLVNESYLKLFDLEREEVIGKTDREIHGHQIDAAVKEHDLAVIEKGQTMEFEETIPVGDENKFYHTIKYPLTDVIGFENNLCGISTNITDLKLTSSQLQERIKEQECLYNISSLPGKVSSIEELLERAVTYLPAGWQYPEITEATIRFGDKVYKTEGYHETEWQLSAESHRIEDKPLKIEVVYTDEKETFDKVVFLQEERQLINSIVETLSSQVKRLYTQKKLKKSEKRWSNLVKNDPNLILIMEPDGTIDFINEAGATILGYGSPDEIVGQNYFDVLELEDTEIDLSKKRIEQVLEGNNVEPHTYKIRDLNGDIRYLESQKVPTTLDDGTIGVQQVAKDVTDREQYEQKLKESLDEKKTLLAEIHHRVKNNLAVISGLLDMQMDQSNNIQVRRQLSDAFGRIQSIALVHEQLYQEAESNAHIDIQSYLPKLLDNIHGISSTEDKDITTSVNVEEAYLPLDQAVSTGLLITELLINTYKHAFVDQSQGHVEVTAALKQSKLRLQVSDDGIGLPEDFSMERGSLGLTLVSTLLEQLNAELTHDSSPGEGTIFTIQIPLETDG